MEVWIHLAVPIYIYPIMVISMFFSIPLSFPANQRPEIGPHGPEGKFGRSREPTAAMKQLSCGPAELVAPY